MAKRGCCLGCLAVLAVPVLFCIFASGVWLFPFPARQIAFEQKVWLPDSTQVLSRENSGVWLPDSHAFATVTLDARDAPAFVAHLKQRTKPKLTGSWSAPVGGNFSGYEGYSFSVELSPVHQGRVQAKIATVTD